MKAAIYLRISSDPKGEQLGVARQRKDCVQLCEAKGWEPVEFVDNDISASNGKHRPAYERMLADIRDGRIGAVVAWDLDRLHRRPIELEAFMELADTHKLALATISGDCDLSTAQGRLTARIKGDVARHEIEHKSDRQRAAAKQKAEAGKPAWRNAFGYLAGPNGPEPDPQTAPLVAQAYAAVLAGSSLRDIAQMFNDASTCGLRGKPWRQTTVSLFLRNPRNAALRAHNKQIVGPGTWKPLVNESTWRATQAVLDAPGRAPGRKSVRKHLLTGVLQCGKPDCSGYLAGQWATKKAGVYAIVYGCRQCRGVSIRAENIEPMLYQLVAGRLARPDAVDLLKAEIHDEAEAEAIRLELETLYGEVKKVGIERGQRLLTGEQAKIATDLIRDDIAKLERRQQDRERLRVFDGIPLGTPEAAAAIRELSPDRFRAVLDVLLEVAIAPVGKSNGPTFNPERVQVGWRT